MAILYRTAEFKSANILVIAILGSTAKFNSCQYFQLYGILCTCQNFGSIILCNSMLYLFLLFFAFRYEFSQDVRFHPCIFLYIE